MDYATFQATYVDEAGTFLTNTTRQVSEADLRQFASDILNTFALSASSNLSGQIYEFGSWDLSTGAGGQVSRSIYCGPSSNAVNCKFFGAEFQADSDASLPYGKTVCAPSNLTPGSTNWIFHGSLNPVGASSIVTVGASGAITAGTDYNQTSINRGYVTLFF